MGVFSEYAPAYWFAGLPVMPCKGKRPVIAGWQRLCDVMPTPEEQAAWIAQYPDHNIGLPLGWASGMVAVDIDTDNPAEIVAIKATLPPSRYERIGRKGCALFYQYNGEKNFSISGKVDFLSSGKQVILPPSIHPDTKQPYSWTGDAL
jgi:hypothetical protein